MYGSQMPGGYSWEFLVGCVVRFFKSWPNFRPKNVIFHTRCQTRTLKSILVFRPGLKADIMLSLLRLERKQTNSSKSFRIRIFLFLSYSFEIETINTFIHSRSSLENHKPNPDQNEQSVYPFSDQNGARTLPDGAAHTYIAYIREYPTPRVKITVKDKFCFYHNQTVDILFVLVSSRKGSRTELKFPLPLVTLILYT